MDEEETRRNKVSKQMKGTVNLEDNVDRGSPQTTTSSSDENENQIQGSVSGHRQAQQDCVNNNETDPHSKTGDSRGLAQGLNNETDPHSKTGDSSGLAQGLKNNKAANCSDTQSANTEGVKGNGTSPKRNGKHKKIMKAESSGVVPEACTAMMLDGISNGPQGPSEGEEEEEEEEEDFLEVSTSCQQTIDKMSLLQSLFSLLQGGMEQSDSSVLPQCLHQIAETYFQEHDYEKAVQFIQLERLYHEQLLCNLSAIQKQWESRRKVAPSQETKPFRNTLNTLEAQELATLTKLCKTHRQPTLTAEKPVAAENTLKNSLIALKKPGEQKKPDPKATTCSSGSGPDTEALRKEKEGEQVGMSDRGSVPGSETSKSEFVGSHQREPLRDISSLQASGTLGQLCTDSLFTKSTDGEGSCFQPAAEELPEDMLTDAETSEQQGEGVGEEPSKTAQKKPVPRQVCPEQQAGGVQCDSSASGEQAGEGNHLAEEVKVKGKGLLSSPPREEARDNSESAAARNEALQSERMSEPGELEGQGGGEEEEEELSLEEGEADLESEDGLKATGRAEEVEETGSPDRDVASSTGGSVAESERDTSPLGSLDAWGLDDSTPSLDDLAKRIEIEEITPAEGLVSILKRRGSLDAAEIPPVKVKGGAKRRVRFQETDDVLDQDEVGMDSCLLLVLLCVVTIFISVGGTALYCTFGDVESSICTDFSNNVDFYFTQMQQKIQELKRWLSPGS
ncbi:consortin-like [Acipenser oxyrinchus oxyrinchus]|uniref:Consortin-like n=1 Tax=Acipenser oxyrinchus oxyrinchus TaxID=40147 RepID=A0AAD8LM52_ACIOX|nr:consortin-like [Acipenser oxyrinchus oxyrinchus]